MKYIFVFALLVFGASGSVSKGDRTITKVVNLLQDMLEKSKKEGDEERKIYAKFKCYCDTSEAQKKSSIESLTEQISILESKIAEIQAETGELSSDCAALKANMAENQQARKDATALRNKENKAFVGEEKDLTAAIAQMAEAIEVLGEVGADQTKSKGADTEQFMAKKASLISLQSQVHAALSAASALMSPTQRTAVAAFVQAPFTGTYTSQSAQIMGILKNMRDTFKTNLEDARTTEKNAKESYGKFMSVKEDAFKSMKDSYEEKQKELGGNDGELSSKKEALSQSQKQLASDEEFLDKLLPMCEDKAKGYENRKLLRANEEAAIAQAISILNSDAAFETFGTVDATKTGASKKASALAQMRSVTRHESEIQSRQVVKTLLENAAKITKSARLAKVVASLQAENPFTTVLDQIDNMIELIGEEAKADKKQLDWCNSERKENKDALADRKREIIGLEESIDKLTTTIDDPKTGLKALIQGLEESLVENKESQKTETTDRTEANVAYQADIKNLVSAESILSKAIKVLNAYYDDLETKLANGEALMQEDPKAPEAWKGDGQYGGQSKKGGDVIEMLNFILSETQNEQMEAHKDEEKAQADYEDSMAQLKKEEAGAEKSLAEKQETLAEKEQDLLAAQEDLKKTTKDKEAIEAYLEKIKPGCDFITKNFDLREGNRKTEKEALEKAVKLIKATPAYKTAVNAATEESYGKCKETCVKDENHVKCKACMADVTVPAFCAGHKGTAGC
jgi:chromosome segregation ATPase